MKLLKKLVFLSLILSEPLLAQESFVIQNIQVKGIQRLTRQTVLNYVPVHAGQQITPETSDSIIETLYKTGFFTNVNVSKQNNDLVISVVERPTIARITITGNKEIKTKKLLEGLQKSKVAEGQIFDAFMLKAVEQAIEQQYTQIGQYQAGVTVKTTPTSENRVNVLIDINEGKIIKVGSIRIEGNRAFKASKLLKEFTMTTPSLFTLLNHNDRYTRERLDADLEKLSNFYLDRGFLKFHIDATDVDVKSEAKKAYITIRITEGDRYTVTGSELTGRLLGQEAQVQKILAHIKPGEYFSRSKILEIKKAIDNHYANQGYAFATALIEPVFNQTGHSVFLKFMIEPGEQVYVRRILFTSNHRTQDLVYRQQMRLMEGSPFSAEKVEESKRRLMNLPYIGDVTVNQLPVDQTSRQIDLEYKLKEVSSEEVKAQVGYGSGEVIYGLRFTGPNFMGTGRVFGIGLDNSQASQHYYMNYTNPWFTPDGISQGFSLFADHSNPGKQNLDPTFRINKYGGNINFGFPMSDFTRLNFALGYERITLHVKDFPTAEVRLFDELHGDKFDNLKASMIWSYSYLDRSPFPTKGVVQNLIGDLGLPAFKKNLRYYKARYDITIFQPIVSDFIFTAGTALAYGNGYGNYDRLPYFLNYYAGGLGSVAGYEQNTLGPRDSLNTLVQTPYGQYIIVPKSFPIGGNALTTAQMGIILPQWFSENFRITVFGNAGNVFQTKPRILAFDAAGVVTERRGKSDGLRYSAGVSFEIKLPILGIVQLSLAKALKKKPGDKTRVFDFTAGASF